MTHIPLPQPSPERAEELFPDSAALQQKWLAAQAVLAENHLQPKPWWGLTPKEGK